MKNYLPILLLILTFGSSCKLTQFQESNKKIEVPAPYVELKSGEKIDAKDVIIKDGLLGIGRGIVADGTKYDPKKVAFFSTGSAKYACAGRSALICPEIIAGKINIYRYMYEEVVTDSKTGRSHYRTRYAYYIQGENEKEVTTISYKHLIKLIPTDAKAHKLLERYNKTHKVTRNGKIAGAAMMIGGFAVAANGNVTTGMLVFCAGALDYMSFAIVNVFNHFKLTRAIKMYNEN